MKNKIIAILLFTPLLLIALVFSLGRLYGSVSDADRIMLNHDVLNAIRVDTTQKIDYKVLPDRYSTEYYGIALRKDEASQNLKIAFTNLYDDGYYILTRVDYNYLTNNYTLIIRPIEGKSGIIPDTRNYRIKFRNTREANEVIVYMDGQKIACNGYVDENDFIVEVNNVSTTKQLTINCKGKDIEIDAIRLINDDIDSIISDIPIKTVLKEEIGEIVFSNNSMSDKRIKIKKLQRKGLASIYVKMILRLLDYVSQI